MAELASKISRRLEYWTNRLALSSAELFFAIFLVFAFLSGVQAHLMPAVYPLTTKITDALLLAVCLPILYFIHQKNQDTRLLWWVAITYWGTFFIEVAGVATGNIFGAYYYGATMWIQWLGVPLVIALNWTLLILATNDFAARVFSSPWLAAILASALIALYDLCIEPVAVALDYWQWVGGAIPVQNYVAWSLVALFFSLPLQLLQIRFRHPLLPIYAGAQLVFFLLLLLFF